MPSHAILALARPEVAPLPVYNAGLSSDAVRARYGVTDVARLASNENPYGASPAVGRALAGLAGQVAWYPDAAGSGAEPGQIVVGNGSEDILQMLCQAFLSPGDRVLTLQPSFGLHEIYPRMMGATVEMLPATQDLAFDVDAWCAAVARGPKLVLLPNPSNPVGCMLDAAGFARLVAAVPAGTLLVVDEAYVEYARLAPGFPDALAVLRAQARPWIVLRTFSKAWGLAGLRVGYGIASDAALVQMLDRVRTPFNVNAAAQAAALAAWGDAAHMEQAVARTVAERRVLEKQLHGLGVPGLRWAASATNFLFIDLDRPAVPVDDGLLARGIIVEPWNETGWTHCLRVTVGLPADNTRFVLALGEIMRTVPHAAA